jgi:acyl carrier protein
MTEAELYEGLRELFEEVFMRPVALRPELAAQDVPGWDSFKLIELLIAIEDRYGVKFHSRELDRLSNVGDLVQVLASKLPA